MEEDRAQDVVFRVGGIAKNDVHPEALNPERVSGGPKPKHQKPFSALSGTLTIP